MKGFIEVKRRDKCKRELLATARIVTIYEQEYYSDIVLDTTINNGCTQNCYVIPTEHTYEQIKQKIAEAIGNE